MRIHPALLSIAALAALPALAQPPAPTDGADASGPALVELQTAFAKTALETYIAELNRASETVSTTVKDSLRPLNERATAVVEQLQAAR